MRLLLSLLVACGDDLVCGAGTHEADGACVGDATPDSGDGSGDDTDADSGGDSGDDPDEDADADGHPASTDCDDTDAAVNPAAAEVCGNGVDDDCDGAPGDCGWSGDQRLPEGAWELAGDRYGDETGSAIAVGDVDGDGIADLLVAARGSDRGGEDAGLAYLLLGPVTADADLADATAVLLGPGGEAKFAGEGIALLGDVDGDGHGDLAVGAPGARTDSTSGLDGAAYVLHGPFTGEVELADAGRTWTGTTGSAAGSAVAAGGDLNADGLPDVAIGARGESAYAAGGGAAFVVFGPAEGEGDLSGADVRIYGSGDCSGERLGASATSLGDVDGDGNDDLAVGGYAWCGGRDPVGAVHVFHGPLSGNLLTDDADARIVGSYTVMAYSLGKSPNALANAGDVDGDGTNDVLVGDFYANAGLGQLTGSAWMVSGAQLEGDVDVLFATWTLEGDARYAELGYAVAPAGDQDGDGFADVVVGAAKDTTYGYDAGVAHLFAGPLTGTDAPADATASFYGGDASWQTGLGLAGGADVTGDGWPDLLVGAPNKESGASYAGSVFVLPGGGI